MLPISSEECISENPGDVCGKVRFDPNGGSTLPEDEYLYDTYCRAPECVQIESWNVQ